MDKNKEEKFSKGKKSSKRFNSKEKLTGKVKKFEGKDIPPYKKGPNDPIWRTSDEVMTKLVATLPFGIAAGLVRDVDANGTVLNYGQPGIMRIGTIVSAGSARDYNSALNLAGRKVYSFVRHANSGSKNYEASDMTIYFVAIGQVLALLSFLQRAHRIINEFSTTNRYTPRLLLQAMGLDADDLLDHQPQLEWLIAWLGRAIGSLAFPDIYYFHACYEAFKYIYVDNDSPKEQYYLLCPDHIGIYNPTYSANGGAVEYKDSVKDFDLNTLMTYQDIHDFVLRRMDILLGDEDCGIISGDILKAFKNGGLFVPAAYASYDVFCHSPEFLQQVHNATIVPEDVVELKAYEQAPGGVNTAPYVKTTWQNNLSILSSKMTIGHYLTIDAFSREPDAKEVVNCTVLNPQFKTYTTTMGGNTYYSIDEDSVVHDLFVPTSCTLVVTISNSQETLTEEFDKTRSLQTTPPTNNALIFTNFDWHPICWVRSQGGGALLAIGDIQNLYSFEYEVGKRIHENSTLSLLGFKELNFVK